MKSTFWLNITLVGCFCLFSSSLNASDTAREKRWADQIVDSIMTGEAEWLSSDGHKFLGIYTEHTTEKAVGGAIILHGTGVHPDWPDVVYPLRTLLPDHGWQTLSLQMPILPNETDYKEYIPLFDEVAPRIKAGIEFLKSKGINNIVIIGHSMGSTMAAYALATTKPDPSVRRLVAVGVAGNVIKDNKKNYFNSLTNIKIPVLDIYGSDDLDIVRDNADKRAMAAKKAGNTRYTQIIVNGANHMFTGKDKELVERVHSWLETSTPQK